MPLNKRKREVDDPLKSDSDDEDYDDHVVNTHRSRPSRSKARRSAKRKRTEYGSESIESDGDVAEDSLESVEEEEDEEEVELDERTGRPKRSSTKKRITYEESEDDSDAVPDDIVDDEEQEAPKKPKRSQILKLKIKTPQHTPAPTTRATRAGSVNRGRRGPSAEPLSAGMRRSGRLHQDEQDPIVALTGSGRHAEVISMGTHSPEDPPTRHTRGGKGVMAPAGSAILEEDEASGSRPKDNDSEDNDGQNEGTGAPEHAVDPEGEGPFPIRRDPIEKSDTQNATRGDDDDAENSAAAGTAAEEPEESADEGDDDQNDDEDPISRGRRAKQAGKSGRSRGSTRNSAGRPKAGGQEPSSDFEFNPGEDEEEELSNSDDSESSPKKGAAQNEDDSGSGRKSGRLEKRKSRGASSARAAADSASDLNDSERAEELLEELEDLQSHRPRRSRRAEIIFNDAPKLRNRKKNVDYRIMRPDLLQPEEAEPAQAVTPSRRGRGAGGAGGWQRSLFSTYGPFGGAGGPPPVFGGPGGIGAAGGVDSDSSDDERPRTGGFGGAVSMTPTSAAPPGLLPPVQAHGTDGGPGPSGTPANLGKIKDRKALADADPLGVDQNVSFDSVGGLQDHINQLKEMVSLPLLYPEIFQRFHVTPPRGVLFHGPPGTGKTLLARALAASVSAHGRKITFYMRKGADALSKWVGEAERQLRLLFEEARTNQPSIIFFDEIDGNTPRDHVYHTLC